MHGTGRWRAEYDKDVYSQITSNLRCKFVGSTAQRSSAKKPFYSMGPTKNRRVSTRRFFVGFRFRWLLPPKVIKMLGRAKLALRKFSASAPNLRRISAAPPGRAPVWIRHRLWAVSFLSTKDRKALKTLCFQGFFLFGRCRFGLRRPTVVFRTGR